MERATRAALEERVLVFATFGGDAALIQRVLAEAGIFSEPCMDLDALCDSIRDGAGTVVLTEEALAANATTCLAEVLDAEPAWSDLPFIVTAADRVDGAPAYGVTVLAKKANVTVVERPMRVRTLVSSVQAALRARRRQYMTRSLIAKVEASEARLRRVQENSPTGLAILRPLKQVDGAIDDFEWIYLNPSGEKAMRQKADDVLGKRHFGQLVDEDVNGDFARFTKAFEEGTTPQVETFSFVDGERRAFRSTAFRLDCDVAVLFEDITERKLAEAERSRMLEREQQARERAETANQMKDEFLATISHELRTPLNAMLGWAKMLNEGVLDGRKSRRALDAIERNALLQAQLIEDLLDISRITSGKMRVEPRRVDIACVIAAAIDSVGPALEAREIELVERHPDEPIHVHADPTRLQQVVWNLLSNAIKFTPRGGTIELASEVVNGMVEVRVKDNGQGIHHEFLPYLFQRFQQADGTRTRAHGGLGLGLAICRHLLELHGGSIEAHSEGPGTGAEFRFRLPIGRSGSGEQERWKPPSRRPTPVPTFDKPEELRGLRVLVVDDEWAARQLIVDVLSECGATAMEASSVEEALQAMPWRPDVLLSDISLPERDGYELIRSIRRLPADAGGLVPAAALTAYPRTEDRKQAMRAGFELHVSKPVEPAELVTAVATLSRISKAMKA